MNKINKFISDIVTESALDPRIPDGLVNLKNAEHIQVVAERLYDRGMDEQIINEFVEQFMDEGKYPERQAYNKDGWLVTFPSKEYRDAALKKGTHSVSDPTHGKGGMNLYYKRKGKQKRQTQQGTSTTEPTKATGQVSSVGPSKSISAPPSQKSEQPAATKGLSQQEKERLARITGRSVPTEPSAQPAGPETKPTDQEPKTEPSDKTEPTQQAPQAAPAIDVPVVTQAPEEYATVSKKFAKQKGWTPTEYGEYRDAEGNTSAVVGLSGEVVPVRTNDREEYKIFAEKNKV
jgi:hypothetical protein